MRGFAYLVKTIKITLMTEKDIVTLPDTRLKKKSVRVNIIDDSVKKLAADMIEATLDWEAHRKHESAAALAAVQIGQHYRVVVIRHDMDKKGSPKFDVYVNPEIVKFEGEPEEELEGCLSVTSIYGSVPRYPKVKVKATGLDGKPIKLTAKGFLARVFQHEIDHLDGKVFLERVEDRTKLFELDNSGEFVPTKDALSA